MKYCKTLFLTASIGALSFGLFTPKLWAQDSTLQKTSVPPLPIKDDKPLRFNLNDEGSHFFQVTFLNQTWLRYNQSNPGTTVQGTPQSETFDIGLRRTRIQMFGQVTDRVFVYFQYGLNNFNYLNGSNGGNRKIQAFFHDAVGEYKVTNGNQLKIGAGLTITNGLSRFSQPSIGTIMALDVPVFLQATVDQTDEFSRKLSVYARGQVGKIDYRFSLSDPFPISSSGSAIPPISSNAYFADKQHHKQYQGYVMYQFFEHEGHQTPYMTGCHLGKKKIFNLASGLIYQRNAMWKLGESGKDTVYQNMLLWSVESFLDMPLNKEKGTAITAHLGYYTYNFGTNYVRTQAQMNPADGLSALATNDPYKGSISKSGNGWPMMGTGNILYAQFGYLLPKDLLGTYGTLQPYVCYQRNNFDLLKNETQVYDLGVNWLMRGHKAKLSLDYQNRPVYKSDYTVGSRRGCVILQYQIFI